MSTAAETYDLLDNDPFIWLEEARGARMSADVVLAAWKEIRGASQTQGDYVKGIWRTATQSHYGGHGIAQYIRQAIVVSPEELELLERLQEYLIWAGRYSIPMKEKRYVNGHDLRRMQNEDIVLIPKLFERLAGEIATHAKANGF